MRNANHIALVVDQVQAHNAALLSTQEYPLVAIGYPDQLN